MINFIEIIQTEERTIIAGEDNQQYFMKQVEYKLALEI